MSHLRGFGDAMQLPAPEHGPEQDNLLPLINIVFLLLIFFMLTGALHAIDYFELRPPTSASEAAAQDDFPVVLVNSAGELAIDNVAVDETDLQLKILDTLAERPDVVVRLKADGQVDAVRVVEVMELLEAVGVQLVILLTLEPED